MSFDLISAFLTFAFVSTITPGPNNMMLLASGLNYGVRRTMPHLAGIVFGFGLLVFLAGMGLFSVLDVFPVLYQALHLLAVVYMLYLAYKIATAKPLNHEGASESKPMTFLQAAAFQWVNPKAIVVAIAAITTYVPETSGADFLVNVSLVALLFAAMTIPTMGAWTVLGSTFRKFLRDPLYYKIFNVTMALLLVASLYPLLSETLH